MEFSMVITENSPKDYKITKKKKVNFYYLIYNKMPRRRQSKRSSRRRRPGVTFKIAKKAALQVIKQQSETKTHVADGGGGTTSANAFSVNNNLYYYNIAQGDTQALRDGNQIRVTKTALDIHFTINQDYFAATLTNYPVYCRVVEYTPIEDQQDNLTFTFGYDQVDLDRFRVHSDQVMVMTESKPWARFKRTRYHKRPQRVQWSDATGASVCKNNRKIYWCFYDEIGGVSRLPITGGTAMVNFVYQYRCNYKDM